MSRSGLVTAGQRVALEDQAPSFLRATVEAAAGGPATDLTGPCDVLLDRLTHDPDPDAFTPVTRRVWAGPEGVLLESAGGSGFTQLWSPCADQVGATSASIRVSSRWSPSVAEAAAARLLPQRHRALRAQVLLHYPALWAALAVGGMSPMHVSLVEVDGVALLLAGPGGVGKSSLVAEALAGGARASCDNLGVSDGRVVHGLVEPLRLPARTGSASKGARAAHGRREHAWAGRLTSLRPEVVLVVRRDDHGATQLRRVGSERAARELVAGTYAAGELQRFWPLVAQLALAGFGPAHPPLWATAAQLTASLPCFELTLGRPDAPMGRGRLSDLLARELTDLLHPPAGVHIPLQNDRSSS